MYELIIFASAIRNAFYIEINSAWDLIQYVIGALFSGALVIGIWNSTAWIWRLGIVSGLYLLLWTAYMALTFDSVAAKMKSGFDASSASHNVDPNIVGALNRGTEAMLYFTITCCSIYSLFSIIVFYRNRRIFSPAATNPPPLR